MIKRKKLKFWLKYGIMGFVIHTLATLAILGTNINCKEMCLNPLNLLLIHVMLPALLIMELLGISIFSQSAFVTLIIILSGIVGFIVGAIIGKIKEKSHSK